MNRIRLILTCAAIIAAVFVLISWMASQVGTP